MKLQRCVVKKFLCIIAVILCLWVAAFSAHYLFHTHQQLLAAWFTLNNCFYKSSDFATGYFNEATRDQGNLFAGFALLISFVLIFCFIKNFRTSIDDKRTIQLFVAPHNRFYYLSIVLFSLLAWLFGYLTIPTGFDEVFSADQCASLPILQLCAYYMLPNNHIGFNVLNKLLFFWVDNKVITGKIISLLAYIAWNVAGFCALKKILPSKGTALLASCVLALQFPVWGFSFQARGYELYGLCTFVSFLSLWAYAGQLNRGWLILNVLVSLMAYACMPTFMYMHVAQILFGLWLTRKRKQDLACFFKYQALIAAGTFFFYLPALCYSGVSAFTNNKYMHAVDTSTGSFLVQTLQGLPSYFNYAFSRFTTDNIFPGIVAMLLPVVALAGKRARHKEALLYYTLLLIATILIMVIMKRHPYHRNLIAHFYIMLFLCVAISNRVISQWTARIKISPGKRFTMPVLLTILLVYFAFTNSRAFNFNLYYDDLQQSRHTASRALMNIADSSSIACSDGAFYIAYIARDKKMSVIKCGVNQAQYYIITKEEIKPAALIQNYTPLAEHFEYLIYRRH